MLLGDAAATAHFSIGSGTKLAMEGAVRLAEALVELPTLEEAFAHYEESRRVEALRLQSAARNSLAWFEDVERYIDLDPVQFNYSLLTRSQRISHENLRLRRSRVASERRALVPGTGRGAEHPGPPADVRALHPPRLRLETGSSSRPWPSTRRRAASPETGIWSTTPSGRREERVSSPPR